jgi:hypothetical protein
MQGPIFGVHVAPATDVAFARLGMSIVTARIAARNRRIP